MKAKEEKLIQLAEVDKKSFAIEIKDGNIRFNLTEMAKSYRATPEKWLRTDESNRYLKCLAVTLKWVTADLVTIKQGGKPHEQGAWANDYRIALEFARWLDPMFSIRVNELIWKLLARQAVVAEPIAGVWPVIQNGRTGYPRRDIMLAAGYSPKSGMVGKLKKRHPDHHFTIARVACVSAEFARLRMEQGKVRQMELQLREAPALG
jgi:hypothetical protein